MKNENSYEYEVSYEYDELMYLSKLTLDDMLKIYSVLK